MTSSNAIAGPVARGERIDELDVLRGVALFGVLAANFLGFAGADLLATQAQIDALPTARIDQAVGFLSDWLITDKANTMFATLFGIGFYIQMKRAEARPGFERRYARRLFWLLVFGWLNTTLLWVWDILNLYALAGFLLLAMRRWRTRTLLIFGLLAACYNQHLQETLIKGLGMLQSEWDPYSETAILERQAAALSGNYGELVALFWRYTYAEWLANGLIVAWLIYATGRFALGAVIGRSGLVEDIAGHLPLLQRLARTVLPLGLALALPTWLLADGLWQPGGMEVGESIGGILRAASALILACGYACAIVVVFQHGPGRRFFGLFRPVGQMALTNYLVQGFAYGLVLTGVGPGLGLAGKIGNAHVLAICVAFFAAQIAVSHWWLARYRFGPMEWLWRWLTYGGAMPSMRVER